MTRARTRGRGRTRARTRARARARTARYFVVTHETMIMSSS